MGTDSLRFQFFSDATQTTLVKTTTITKSTQTPPAGYLKGWSFTVAYPDGESNTTQTWISAPGDIEKTRVITGTFDREWESSLATPVRTLHYRERLSGVLVKYTIDSFAPAPWGNEELLTSSTVVLDGGTSGLTMTYSYWNTPADTANHKKLALTVGNDSSWTASALSTDGLSTFTVSPFGSTPPPTLNLTLTPIPNWLHSPPPATLRNYKPAAPRPLPSGPPVDAWR